MITCDHIGKTASFRLHSAAIIPIDFTSVVILGIGGYEVVPFIDPASLHVSIYPTLPAETPNDYRLYQYAIVRLPNGVVTAVGLPWIDETSLKIETNSNVELVVPNADATDISKLKVILAGHGYHDVTAKVVGY